MIIHVETHDRPRYTREVSAYFRLRKTVFHDQLGWDVPVHGDEERDPLDEMPCTYALSVDAAGAVNAGIRLIPTTQTTLLDLAFDGLVPEGLHFSSPTIWELSRFCVDRRNAGGRLPVGLGLATLELSLANFEYARRNGITHYITVTEQRIFELTRVFDLGCELLGHQTIDGCPVVCCLIQIDEHVRRLTERYRPLMQARQPSCRDATSHAPAPAASQPDREIPVPTRRSPQA
ncbi:acyl-homoserine-lactone synthase [Oricola sp.]|uniref:acyl-homoserine-lactone synthase n=1 Tax=Oricola sp. TaxID=1979950 RepID=UPI0025D8C1EC|nr:acyl-homoserine-lactone synthase [Oricola sp.]MCI5074225.1 hypothetical protein [Oricola sp.]